MSYNDITLNDPSRIKRFIQERRFVDAMKLLPQSAVATVIDFGAGNGELSRRLATKCLESMIVCYEPGGLLQEARDTVGKIANVRVVSNSKEIGSETADIVYCLEVFEHLPNTERETALGEIHRILKSGGVAIIGVPIEVGPPALPKGLFRMARRRGEFDARTRNIVKSVFGRRYENRPAVEIAHGLQYHPHHTGFDYRRLRSEIAAKFALQREKCSPFSIFGPLLNSEIYFVASKN